MKTIMFASGGSGGHLAPAIAMAQNTANAGVRSIIASTRKQVDLRMQLSYRNLEFVQFSGYGFDGTARSLVLFILNFLKSLPKAIYILNRNNVELVFITGGFGCAPLVCASALLGIEVIAHESNSVPGKLTRLLYPLFHLLYVTRLLREKWIFKKSEITGFPLRNMSGMGKAEARKKLDLPAEGKLITIFGGSQGAKSLSLFAEENAKSWIAKGFHVLCISGPTNYQPSLELRGFHVKKYVDDMEALYASTDLLVSRSGAGSISEIAYQHCPCVLVPLPSSADQHQFYNARAFANKGCAELIAQEKLNSQISKIEELVENNELLKEQIFNQKRWAGMNHCKNLYRRLSVEVGTKWL